MFKLSNKIGLVLLFIAFGFFYPISVRAQDNQNTSISNDYINITEERNSDTFLFGNTVEVNAPINGDLFIAAQNITINREVSGNVFLAGENVHIKNKVGGSAYLAGQKVIVEGPIDGSVRLASKNAEIRSTISKSLSFFTENLYIPATGEIEKEAYGHANSLTLEGKVGKDLTLLYTSDDININGKVLGNIYYSDANLRVTDKAYIEGKTINTDKDNAESKKAENQINKTIFTFLKILFITLISLVLLKLKPQIYVTTINKIKAKPAYIFLKGILAVGIELLLIIILAITIIGIPMALLIISVLVVTYLFIAPIPFILWIGNKVISRKDINLTGLLVGALIISIISLNSILSSIFLNLSYILFSGILFEKVQKLFSKDSHA